MRLDQVEALEQVPQRGPIGDGKVGSKLMRTYGEQEKRGKSRAQTLSNPGLGLNGALRLVRLFIGGAIIACKHKRA